MPLAAAAGIGAAGSIFGGLFGASSAKKAAQAQADAANHAADLQHQDAQAALEFQRQQYGDSQRNMAPWLNTGASSISRLRSLMGLDGPDILNPSASGSGFPTSVPGPTGQPTMNRFAQFGANGNFGVMDPSMVSANGNPAMRTAAGVPDQNQLTPGASAGAPGVPGVSGGVSQSPSMMPPADSSASPASPAIAGGPGDGSSGGAATAAPPATTPAITSNPGSGTSGGVATSANGTPIPAPVGGDGAAANPFPTGASGNLDTGWNVGFQAPNAITEQNDPGYKFRLEQGQKLLENSAAAAGTVGGGATSKALNRYGQDYASNEYGNVYNRSVDQYERAYNVFNNNQNTRFNRYAALAGYGQTAASNLNSTGVQTANNLSNTLLTSGQQIGNNINNAGAARASGYVGAGNAIGGAASNMSNLMQQYLLYQQMNKGQ